MDPSYSTPMNLARIQKQLMRDLKRSPAKAAALAGLCLVALYFWAPLVMGWFGKKQSAPPSAQAVIVPAAPAGMVPVVREDWRQIVEWRAKDRRMQSAKLGELASSPFAPKPIAPEPSDDGEGATEINSQARVADTANIDELGLKLTSTMLGPRRRVAVINGRPYAEGTAVQIGDDLTFVVANVLDRSVWLEHSGQRLELRMDK